MGFFSLKSRTKPKPFGFVPRYYDEQKEEREQRLKRLDNPNDIEISKDRIRSGLKSSYRGDSLLKKDLSRKSNLRLLYIIIILALVTVLILRSNSIANFMTNMGG